LWSVAKAHFSIMSDPNSVIITAPTIDDAVKQGLIKLKAKSWEVIVEVLEEPSRGFNGVGEKERRGTSPANCPF
jgi:predicted RNA-binding protein Jag